MNAVHLKELRELCKGNHHSMWCNVFSRHQCTKLNRDDLEAGYRIPGDSSCHCLNKTFPPAQRQFGIYSKSVT
jgi:hypothetical protein